jgi:hypothetical protein
MALVRPTRHKQTRLPSVSQSQSVLPDEISLDAAATTRWSR